MRDNPTRLYIRSIDFAGETIFLTRDASGAASHQMCLALLQSSLGMHNPFGSPREFKFYVVDDAVRPGMSSAWEADSPMFTAIEDATRRR